MKKAAAVLLTLSLALGMAACGGEKTSGESHGEEGVLRVASINDITTMDVTKTTDNYMVPMNVFDRLFEVEVRQDGTTEIVPSLVDSYHVSPDGLTYRFTLREGVVFSNGNPLTASDVEYSFVRLLTSGGVNDEVAKEVQGAAALQSGESSTLAGFRVEDDRNFSVTLETPNAGFVAELTSPAMSVMDRETMETLEDFGSDPKDAVGTGPYLITQWVVNDHYVLEVNPRYWGETPSVKKAVVTIVPDASTQNLMYQNGELDILDLEYLDSAIVESTYKTQYGDRILTAPRVGITYLALNGEQEYLSDIRVRKAIAMAVDVDYMIDSVFHGDAYRENGIIPKGIWGHNEQLERPALDPEGAKNLLKEAGYQEGQVQFELALDSAATGNVQLMYQILQQQLKKAGMDVTITTYDEASWLALRKSGKMDAFINKWTMDYNDPANIMATFFGSAEKSFIRSVNYGHMAVMERVAAASAIVDDGARMKEYQELEKMIVQEDAAWIPLLGNNHLFALGDRVESFTPYWAGYSNFYVKNVTLK